MTIIYGADGVPRKASVYSAANKLHKLKKESGSSPWPVIAECFNIWEKTHPTKYDSYIMYLDDIKQTRKNKFAVSYGSNGQMLRYTIDIPKQVMYMIRAIYDPNELPMDKEFWYEFAKRFKKYQVAEKL